MSTTWNQIAVESNGRYFNAEERRRIQDYAASVSARISLSERIEQREEAILRSALERLQPKYPNFAKYHDQAWARQFRDAQLVLRASTQAMVLDDLAHADDRLLYWLRSMFAANNYTPDFVRDCFRSIKERVQEEFSAEEFALIRPMLERAATVLSDFPEPMSPAV